MVDTVKYPKVLIVGQPFNNDTGGGITLSNLFKGWPKEDIAVLFAPWEGVSVSTDHCLKYYQIGQNEHKWKFPFRDFKQPFPASGLIDFNNSSHQTFTGTPRSGLKGFLARKIINPVLDWLGVYHSASEIVLSPLLKKWLDNFRPEVIYFQVSSLEGIIFAERLIDYLHLPSAIHMMDDWPSTISDRGLFKRYWKSKIDAEFRQLLNRVDLHLSISDAMSDEYLKRYQKHFTSFHNPVEIAAYLSPVIKMHQANSFRILYLGRIGTANKKSIILFAKIISQLKIENQRIELEIYSKDYAISYLKQISDLDNVKINPPVPYESVPGMLKEFDLLFLPLDFSSTGLKFAQFSIPTKATEYMLSGTPVFVLAPEKTAVSKFFKENNCGYCVSSPDEKEIIRGIQFLINNEEYRKRISANAMNLAKEKFDSETVRQKFLNVLLKLSEKKASK
jgi:glycosyltransferase involved in cell wall biosynthesis